jgi:hypothetical protein
MMRGDLGPPERERPGPHPETGSNQKSQGSPNPPTTDQPNANDSGRDHCRAVVAEIDARWRGRRPHRPTSGFYWSGLQDGAARGCTDGVRIAIRQLWAHLDDEGKAAARDLAGEHGVEDRAPRLRDAS